MSKLWFFMINIFINKNWKIWIPWDAMGQWKVEFEEKVDEKGNIGMKKYSHLTKICYQALEHKPLATCRSIMSPEAEQVPASKLSIVIALSMLSIVANPL